MKNIFLLFGCFWVLMCGPQLKSSSTYTIKAKNKSNLLNCEKGKYFIAYRNKEIEFSCLGIKRSDDQFYRIKAGDLLISKDEGISQVFYSYFEDDLILVFDKSSIESGSIIICRINFAKSLVKWKTELPSMNPSCGIIEDRFLYQAGVGMISKINLNSGLFEWKHGGIKDPETGVYFEFITAFLKNNNAIFTANEKDDEPKIKAGIIVDKMNGKILSFSMLEINDKQG